MNFFILDAGAPFLLEFVMLIFLVLATVVEAIVLIIMKFNSPAKCFLDALLVNLGSLVAGYLLLNYVSFEGRNAEGNDRWMELAVMFAVTVIVEGLLLMLLNRKKPVKSVWLGALAINVVSYILLAIFISQ